jgi:glycosyltransferase involved in cell wall biosynthesis
MKVYINLPLRDGPYGGGNQFLRGLAAVLARRGQLVHEWQSADVVLFNNYHEHELLHEPAVFSGPRVIVQRVPGLARLQAHPWDRRDDVTRVINRHFADATIFQSEWARKAWQAEGVGTGHPTAVILNAPDPEVFFTGDMKKDIKGRKLKLVAASWSSNPRKGFDTYAWLDRNLDFSRYEMTFVGNAPFQFRNIHQAGTVEPRRLAEIYREHDVYVTGVRHEPCSNALIEAMHCGLPAVALDDGGSPQIVGNGGRLFHSAEEIPGLLEDIREHYAEYRQAIDLPDLEKIVSQYCAFFTEVMACGPRQRDLAKGRKELARSVAAYRLVDRLLYWRGKAFSLFRGPRKKGC